MFFYGGKEMKKILCVLSVCLLLAGCSQQATNKNKMDDKQASLSVDEGTLQYLNAARGNGNENGYYRISDLIEKKDNVYSNIRYFDFASKKEIVLCNKPECKHDNDSCNAYISMNENNNPMLFVQGDYLYLFKRDMSSSSVAFDTEGKIDTVGANEGVLERMDLDGNNRKVIATWNDETIPNDFAYNNHYLYMRMDIAAQKEGSGNKISYNKESYIQQIDLETGKKKKLLDASDLQLLGVYKNKLLFMKYYYDKDPNSLLDDDNAYIANIQNAKVEITSYDPISKKTLCIRKWIRTI